MCSRRAAGCPTTGGRRPSWWSSCCGSRESSCCGERATAEPSPGLAADQVARRTAPTGPNCARVGRPLALRERGPPRAPPASRRRRSMNSAPQRLRGGSLEFRPGTPPRRQPLGDTSSPATVGRRVPLETNVADPHGRPRFDGGGRRDSSPGRAFGPGCSCDLLLGLAELIRQLTARLDRDPTGERTHLVEQRRQFRNLGLISSTPHLWRLAHVAIHASHSAESPPGSVRTAPRMAARPTAPASRTTIRRPYVRTEPCAHRRGSASDESSAQP